MAVKTTRRYATTVLKQDHKQVKKLFGKYEKLGSAPSGEKQNLYSEIVSKIERHADAEEAWLYPAIETLGTTESMEAVKKAQAQHQTIKDLIGELRMFNGDPSEFDAKMKVLCENVDHHAKEEESEILPLLKKLSKDRQDEVSRGIVERLLGETPI